MQLCFTVMCNPPANHMQVKTKVQSLEVILLLSMLLSGIFETARSSSVPDDEVFG